jgi:hypothetical protein
VIHGWAGTGEAQGITKKNYDTITYKYVVGKSRKPLIEENGNNMVVTMYYDAIYFTFINAIIWRLYKRKLRGDLKKKYHRVVVDVWSDTPVKKLV